MNIVWHKKYNVNVIEIDEQYYSLIKSINDVIKQVKRGVCANEMSKIIDRLQTQSEACFCTEEVYFEKLGFCNGMSYQEGHATCLLKLNLFKNSYDEAQPLINLAHIEGIASAFLGHVATSHTEFNHYMKEHGIRRFIKAHG